MWGVIPVKKTSFSSPVRNIKSLDQNSELLHAMVTCHTLTIIREELCGDPMDLKVSVFRFGAVYFSHDFTFIT